MAPLAHGPTRQVFGKGLYPFNTLKSLKQAMCLQRAIRDSGVKKASSLFFIINRDELCYN